MSQPEPNFPKATCPTCERQTAVSLPEEPGSTITTICGGCGKVLLIERGNTPSSMVVKEQWNPIQPVVPEAG
jgi:ribosomal protein S27E